MSNPKDCLFNEGHLWCRCENENTAVIGISNHAQDSLGEIAYLELPGPGTTICQGESLGIIESIKVVNELIAPVSGTVVEINSTLDDDPTAVNQSPYGDGWMLIVKLDSIEQLNNLMSGEQYEEYIG